MVNGSGSEKKQSVYNSKSSGSAPEFPVQTWPALSSCAVDLLVPPNTTLNKHVSFYFALIKLENLNERLGTVMPDLADKVKVHE